MRELCLREEEENIRELVRIRDHSPADSSRLGAISLLLDRSAGKAVQPQELLGGITLTVSLGVPESEEPLIYGLEYEARMKKESKEDDDDVGVVARPPMLQGPPTSVAHVPDISGFERPPAQTRPESTPEPTNKREPSPEDHDYLPPSKAAKLTKYGWGRG